MSRNDQRRRMSSVAPMLPEGEPIPLDEPDETACLRIARYKDGRLAVQLEINEDVKRGNAEPRGKREALADLARAVGDLQALVAAPVGRGRR